MFKKILFIVIAIGLHNFAIAQQGFLRGKIIDAENGEELFGTTIVVKGTTNGTTADFDGNYSLPLNPGTYTISYSFVSYLTKEVTDIVIKSGEVTNINIDMVTDNQQLEAVVVKAERLKDNETAMLALKQKSINSIDGISSQAFKTIGDNNLSSAMKRVTGVSVQGGKYVYVRGLGDRYTKTTLNGMNIPGLDPDRNDVQIDLFPTSILENVVVYKTFSPNLSGDFTGGLVNIETKAFPEEKYTSVSVGLSFNPDMHFNNDYLVQEGSGSDFLGFGSDDRELRFDKSTEFPDPTSNDPRLEALTRSVNPNLAVQNGTSFMNTNVSLAHGNQINRDNVTFGYNAVLNYRREQNHYDAAINQTYEINNDKAIVDLIRDKRLLGARSEDEVLWSALLSGSMKTEKSSYSVNFLRIQNGSELNLQRIVNSSALNTPYTHDNDVLRYTQRQLTNVGLIGKHQVQKLQIGWKLAGTVSKVDEPDFRNSLIDVTNPDDISLERNGGGINRYSRYLNEKNLNAKVDFTLPIGEKSKIRFGADYLTKAREFDLFQYDIKYEGNTVIPNDPDWFLKPENVYSASTGTGSYLVNFSQIQNEFDGRINILAAYAMTELDITSKFKTIFGLRVEKAGMFYTGVNQNQVFDDEQTLNDLDFLPSVNLVYKLQENMNLRASYNKTLARPSFREKSIAIIPDPISDLFFIGNINLKATNVDNFDLRWEYFFRPEEVLSVSLFYKDFTNHIILATYDLNTDQLRPRNVPQSKVYGIELEARKKLDFFGDFFSKISVGTNISIVYSEVDRRTAPVNDPDPITGTPAKTEYEDRLLTAREGQAIDTKRDMVGQSPYLINGFLNYADRENGLNASLAYNVQGQTLTIRGVGFIPDIYTNPFHSLNFNISKTIGVEQKSSVSFGIDNILNDDNELVYKNAGSIERPFSQLSPGRSFSLKYSVNF